jgi:hypothetical protein
MKFAEPTEFHRKSGMWGTQEPLAIGILKSTWVATPT